MSITSRVLGRLHPGAVAVVAGAQVGGERVGADVGTLGLASLLAHAAVGDEIDLHVRVRADDRADVAPFDDRVAELGQLPLALAHHLAHLRVARDDGHHAVDPGLPDRRGDVAAGDRDASRLVQLDPVLARELARARSPSPRSIPSCIASQVSARYMAPVSR